MAAILLGHVAAVTLAAHIHALPWLAPVLQPRLHLGAQESQRAPELSGAVCLLGAVPTLGPAGLLVDAE